MNSNAYTLKNRKVVVVGAGISGVAAARLAHREGAHVTLNDIAERAPLDLPPEIKTLFGAHPEALLLGCDTIVLSPGVPPLEVLQKARCAGVEVIGEVELSLRFTRAKIGAITGTNGKSTTVSLLGELLKTTGAPVFTGGNLGDPLADAVGTPALGSKGLVSLELSSFQLETITSLRPKVAALLNLTEDHLDRYTSFAHYVSTKRTIFRSLPSDGFALLNYDDPLVCEEEAHPKGETLGFSVRGNPHAAFRLLGDSMVFSGFDLTLDSRRIPMPGLHNRANTLAAVGCALLMGAAPGPLADVVYGFKGLPHRMEFTAERGGVRFYNDSKATNIGSVLGSLSGFEGRYVLILGGRHKGAPYTPLAQVLRGGCKAVVAMGESASLILADLQGLLPLHEAPSFEEAVRLAHTLASPGESVVLSPACSSYDMFPNYRVRGERFRELSRTL